MATSAFTGSTAGVAFEYIVHTVAYNIGDAFESDFLSDSGKHLSVGKTIFADYDPIATEKRHFFTKSMIVGYVCISSGAFTLVDIYMQMEE